MQTRFAAGAVAGRARLPGAPPRRPARSVNVVAPAGQRATSSAPRPRPVRRSARRPRPLAAGDCRSVAPAVLDQRRQRRPIEAATRRGERRYRRRCTRGRYQHDADHPGGVAVTAKGAAAPSSGRRRTRRRIRRCSSRCRCRGTAGADDVVVPRPVHAARPTPGRRPSRSRPSRTTSSSRTRRSSCRSTGAPTTTSASPASATTTIQSATTCPAHDQRHDDGQRAGQTAVADDHRRPGADRRHPGHA